MPLKPIHFPFLLAGLLFGPPLGAATITISATGSRTYSITGTTGATVTTINATTADTVVWDTSTTGSNHTLYISAVNSGACSLTFANGA
ncbi:MAG TPA: hypothetical protein VMV05_01665, partial [bacterium]|nr:hypothetical protein [bacterium]